MAQTQSPAYRNSEGENINYTPASQVYAGDVVLIGTIPMIAPLDIAANSLGALACFGVFAVPKSSGVIAAGDAIYWDPTGSPNVGTASTGACTGTPTSYLMGWAIAAALTGDQFTLVNLKNSRATGTIAGAVTADSITGSDSSLGVIGIPGNNGAGGAVVIAGGTGNNNANGGDMTVNGGANDGTGTYGNLNLGTSTTANINMGLLPTIPVTTVAVGGTAIGNANAVVIDKFTLVTGADNTAAVKLPVPVAGHQVIIKNSVGTALLIVFPSVGTQINAKGNNNAFNLGNAAVRRFTAYNSAVWFTDPETIV